MSEENYDGEDLPPLKLPKPKVCKDCLGDPESATSLGFVKPRPAPHPGPRCATHHREFKKATKARTAERRNTGVYGLAEGDYERLYEFQGRKCAMCQRATGKVKRLAVEHDHATGLVRMLACGPCNKIIAQGRDDPEWFERVAELLRNPPAKQLGIVAVHQDNRINEDNTITPESW